MVCPRCGTELTPKSKVRLIVVGGALLATIPSIVLFHWLIPLVLMASSIGIYLIAWATRGQGLWCRTCKKVPYLSKRL